MKMQPPYLSYKHRPVGRTSVRHCSTKVEPTTFRNILQSGFTLLEMVLVLFLVGLMASATLMLTEGVEDQAKYDDTKRRMEIMRKAIVGDPTRTVNGGPEISGFVADMGRLPGCVRELLEPLQCDGSPLGAWSIDASTGLGFGWRGPYIAVLPERNGDLRFRDGYGNTGTDVSGATGSNLDASNAGDEERDSGWTWKLLHTSNASDAIIHLQSYGINGSNKYPKGTTIDDVVPLVYERNHLINIDSLSGRIRFLDLSTAIPSTDLKLILHYPDSSGAPTSETSDFTIDASTAASGYSPLITFTSGKYIPMGVRAIQIVCDDVNGYVYDGTCTNSTDTPSENITISPTSQTTQFNLIWDIP